MGLAFARCGDACYGPRPPRTLRIGCVKSQHGARKYDRNLVVDPYRASRQFERKVFGGVPEHPEPSAEREPNDHATDRLTGRSHEAAPGPVSKDGWVLIATTVYDRAEGTITCRRERPSKTA